MNSLAHKAERVQYAKQHRSPDASIFIPISSRPAGLVSNDASVKSIQESRLALLLSTWSSVTAYKPVGSTKRLAYRVALQCKLGQLSLFEEVNSGLLN